jgi:hypothetical protein
MQAFAGHVPGNGAVLIFYAQARLRRSALPWYGLASPEAAASVGVQREADHWRT